MELLAPAGNPQSFKSALESGADAIYLGLPWFNARRPAMNFTPETLGKALKEAKAKGVKVYITLNTDLKSSEIEDAAKVLHLIRDLKVDAVIIKDLGLYYLARECFSDLELHLSTQFGISNSYAAEEAKKLGATRVIPARELSFKELQDLESSGKDIPEIEAFVQGSMCFSFSGKCLLSSWVGGKSANRGVCQAPCRLKYSHNETANPYFSMKDLNLVSRLNDLEKSGVSSLKIEGRLKSPGWVSSISSIYRNALDGNANKEDSVNSLLKYSGREMGEGFASGLKDLTAENSGKFGKYSGKVLDLTEFNGEQYAILDFTKKSADTSLRFVTDDGTFLTIIHPADAEIKVQDNGNGLIRNIGKIEKGSSVYEVIPARNSGSGIGKMRYDVELEVIESDIMITLFTDSGRYQKKEPYKNIVKAKRGVFPDAVYDKLENKVVDGWRLNKLYCDDIPLSKTQVNSIVKHVSYILAVTIRESNPLNSIELDSEVLEFISPLNKGESSSSKEVFRYNFSEIDKITEKNIIIDEIQNNKGALDRLISYSKEKSVTISMFPICFEKDMEDLASIIKYLESHSNFKYEINDIGHYNLLVNYLAVPLNRIVSGQGLSCYNHLSVKFLKDELGLEALSIPMEMDSRGIIKLVEDTNGYADLRFTSLADIPGMYSRVQSDEFYEGSEFEDKIGNILKVHKYRDINIFFLSEYYSSEGCRDLDGILFSEVIKEKKCLNHPEIKRKKFNLERRLY